MLTTWLRAFIVIAGIIAYTGAAIVMISMGVDAERRWLVVLGILMICAGYATEYAVLMTP